MHRPRAASSSHEPLRAEESDAAQLVRLTPSRSPRPWGSGRFGTVDGIPVGELWISGDDSTLPDGRTLAGAGLAASVPLVKLLDVGGTLSVQVHPDDAAARQLEGSDAIGKHESWVVLEAPSGASLALGLAPGARVDDLLGGDERTIVDALRSRPVRTGSVVDIPPGTVHAPAGGLLLYEVQQRSDLTYRIWDWGRSRPLHPDEARQAIHASADPRVTELPDAAGCALVSDPAAPFRIIACRSGGGESPVEVATDRPGVLSVVEGGLRFRQAGDEAGAGVAVDAGSHWLLPPGRWMFGGRGLALVATW